MNSDHISGKLAIFALAMFGFGYALVPIYDVLCDITGLNGKTGEITAESVSKLVVDYDRTVTVQFDTNVNSELPWTFKAVDKTLVVHPGEVTEAVFIAVNTSSSEVTGIAVFQQARMFLFYQADIGRPRAKRNGSPICRGDRVTKKDFDINIVIYIFCHTGRKSW